MALTLLLLSDIHLSDENIEKLVQWQKAQQRQVDYVFYLGDFDNMTLDRENPDLALCAQSEERVRAIFDKINAAFQPKQAYFIPGNHDSHNMFAKQIDLGASLNLHKKVVHVQDLAIAGFGGSVSSRFVGSPDLVPGWQGYPYLTEEEYRSDIVGFLENSAESLKGRQVILLTHMGPSFSGTSLFDVDLSGRQIQGGNLAVSELLREDKYNFLANFHGHVHDSQGQYIYKNIRVINDGPLKQGQFTFVELAQTQGYWGVRNVEFRTL